MPGKEALPQALAERSKNLLFFNWLIETGQCSCDAAAWSRRLGTPTLLPRTY